MSDANAHLSAVRAYFTGAVRPLGAQDDVALSIGGYQSVTEGVCLTALRDPASAIYGIRIVSVASSCGAGTGYLNVPTADHLQWKEPGASAYGTSIAIAIGETMALPGATASKWIVVERVAPTTLISGDMAGTEPIALLETFNAPGGGPDFVSEAASGYSYTAMVLKNVSLLPVTALSLTPGTDVAIATEAIVSGALTQATDAFTAPSGISFSASPITGLTLAAGASIGLWIRRAFGASVSAKTTFSVLGAYTCNAVTSSCDLRGLARRGKVSTELYRLYVGDNAQPDFNSAPYDTGAAITDLSYPCAENHTYYWEILAVNRFGLAVTTQKVERLVIGDDFDIGDNPPTDPIGVTMTALNDGTVLIVGQYLAGVDVVSADSARIYLSFDGTDPAPGSVTPVDVPLVNNAIRYVSAALVDGTPVKAIVRSLRAADSSESESLTVVSATAKYVWTHGGRPQVSLGRSYGAACPIQGSTGKQYIDEAKDIYWYLTGVSTELWAGSVLVLAIRNGKVKTFFDLDMAAFDGGAGTGPVDVGTWTDISKLLYLVVASERVVEVDVLGAKITGLGISGDSVTACTAPYGAWSRYSNTVLMEYNAVNEQWFAAVQLEADGTLKTGAYELVACANQEECLA